MREGLVRALLALAAAVGVLVGLVWLGRRAADQLRDDPRYHIALADLDCEPPPGQERGAFLTEVQYLAELPDRFSLLDDELAVRLAGAFTRHPWVENVRRVEIQPARGVRVQLVYRTPVLTVLCDGQPRAVDRAAVLLPNSADTSGLPRYRGRVTSEVGRAGAAFGGAGVAEAAGVAALLRGDQACLKMRVVDVGEGGTRLECEDGSRVLWGPSDGPASPEMRRQRLREYCAEHGGLGGTDGPREHDVRQGGEAVVRTLPRP